MIDRSFKVSELNAFYFQKVHKKIEHIYIQQRVKGIVEKFMREIREHKENHKQDFSTLTIKSFNLHKNLKDTTDMTKTIKLVTEEGYSVLIDFRTDSKDLTIVVSHENS